MDHLEFRLLSHTTTPAGESAAFALQVPQDLLYLQGHFPGYPLLPGIAQLLAIALDRTHSLWQGSGREPPRKLAERVIAAAVGDGSDYYIDQAGELYVRSLANRAQSGSGRLVASGEFVRTATRVAAVRAHSGRALYLAKSGEVFATGSNVTGPLSKQGPGDKATAGGSIFTGASGIATGAAHSAAIRPDGSLWAWGSGFASEPKKIADHVVAVAAGSTSTIALTADGRVLAWDAGRGPRQIVLDR